LSSFDRLTVAFTDVARTLHPHPSVDATLEAIAAAAIRSIPGFNMAGISTVDNKGNVETRAVTEEQVCIFDELQYTFGEGPCLDALGAAHLVTVPHLRREQRWPRYVPEVLRHGLRSQMAVKMAIDDEGTVGGLNLYSTVRDDIDEEAPGIAELFAVHAATALGSVTQVETLNAGMQTRKIIGQALGLLMERYHLDEDRAFGFLVRVSQNENIKLRDVAQGLVDAANAENRTTSS
jgi:GAF domain-containing protein